MTSSKVRGLISRPLPQVPRSDAAHGALWPSCAIVGNSGNLINAGHGADIDRHAMVLR